MVYTISCKWIGIKDKNYVRFMYLEGCFIPESQVSMEVKGKSEFD